jgi:hypothetical protein
MAALYAQGLAWERMHGVVRAYAAAMGSVRHLLSDLTLPLISVFSGAGFDRVVRDSMGHGAARIEDLWLRCAFCSFQAAAACTSKPLIRCLLGLSPKAIIEDLWLRCGDVACTSVALLPRKPGISVHSMQCLSGCSYRVLCVGAWLRMDMRSLQSPACAQLVSHV